MLDDVAKERRKDLTSFTRKKIIENYCNSIRWASSSAVPVQDEIIIFNKCKLWYFHFFNAAEKFTAEKLRKVRKNVEMENGMKMKMRRKSF